MLPQASARIDCETDILRHHYMHGTPHVQHGYSSLDSMRLKHIHHKTWLTGNGSLELNRKIGEAIGKMMARFHVDKVVPFDLITSNG